MYIEKIPNRNSPPAILLRESCRKNGKVVKRTVANLSKWPAEKIEALNLVLKEDYKNLTPNEFAIESSLAHGHVHAIVETIKKIGLDKVLYSKPLRERNLVIAMIAEQLIHPCSKLGQTRIMPGTTLLEELEIDQVNENELYNAMDWLFSRQSKIEKKLSTKHLSEGANVLYDVTSSYYEGNYCLLAQRGYNRDKKKGKKSIVYGMMANSEGCPVAVDVFAGNTGDPTTVPDQIEKLRENFGLKSVVIVGDRGMLTQTQINKLKDYPGIKWISALRSEGIRKLVQEGSFQPSLFDQQGLAEITSAHYKDERLVVCYNPFMAEERKRKREDLLLSTEEELEKIANQVQKRKKKLHSKEEIALKAGKIINKYKMSKHFELEISTGKFNYARKEEAIKEEAEIDGFYVIRTNVSKERLSAEDSVRQYKSLSKVENIFRTMKGVEILVRPIRHRKEERVRAHIFICMLAYYVEWHMRQKLAPVLFMDEEAEKNRIKSSPVEQALPSKSVKRKKSLRKFNGEIKINSFKTLIAELATRTRNICSIKNNQFKNTFKILSNLNPTQKKVFELLEIRTQ